MPTRSTFKDLKGERFDSRSMLILLRSRHELECNILNEVVIEEGYIRVTMRVKYKDI